MADRPVEFRLLGKDEVTPATKSAGKGLESLGRQAVDASRSLLSIERAKAGIEVVGKAADVAGKAFEAMSKQSKSMAGELGAAGKAWDHLVGTLGDTLATSRGFKATMDGLVGAMQQAEGWIRANAETIDGMFVGAVRGAIFAVDKLILMGKGWIELITLGKAVLSGAQQESVRWLETTLTSLEGMVAGPLAKIFAAQLGVKVTEQDIAELQADIEDREKRAARDNTGAMDRELAEAARRIEAIEEGSAKAQAALAELDKMLAERKGGNRPTRVSDPAREKELSEYAKRLASENDRVLQEALTHNEAMRKAAADGQRALTEAVIAGSQERQRAAMEAAERQREAAEQEKASLLALAGDAYTGFLKAMVEGADIGEALMAQVGDALTRLGESMISTGIASLLAGPAASLFGLSGAGLIAAGTGVTAAGVALSAYGSGSGSSGGSASSAPAASGSSSQPATLSSSPTTSAPRETFQVVQNFYGTYVSESEAARKAEQARRNATRDGQISANSSLSRGR